MVDVVKTVKPLAPGDEDFTTWQTWETAADGVSTALARWVAESYSGGNCGRVSLGGWVVEDTRIYGADGHRPTGPIHPPGETVARGHTNNTVAVILTFIANVEVDGVQLDCIDAGNREIVRIEGGGFVLKNCIGEYSGTGSAAFGVAIWSKVSNAGVMPILTNNYFDGTAATALRAMVSLRGAANTGFDEIVNMTVRSKAGEFAYDFLGSGSLVNFMGNCYGDNWTGTGAITSADGCASEDTSAPGTNTVKSVVEADAFTDVASLDCTLKDAASVLFGGGQDMTGQSDGLVDIIGTVRPQGAAQDIGAQEVIVAAAGATGRSRKRVRSRNTMDMIAHRHR